MKNILFSFVLVFLSVAGAIDKAGAVDKETQILNQEYQKFYSLVEKLQPDALVGGLLKSKKFNDHEILWKLAESENDYTVIRIYREHNDGSEDFAITYYYARHIVPGTLVIRRFIGPAVGSGWRNDTVDLESGDYLGSQGQVAPVLNSRDQELLTLWSIKLF